MKTLLLPRLRRSILMLIACLWLFQAAAWCEESWRADFDDICAKTGDAMALSRPELTQLIGRCATLQKVIETEEPSVRKVYLKRLEMCRNLYAYVLEYKNDQQPAQ
jgi:hypothetical protein